MEFGVTARVIDYLGLPGDHHVQNAKPAAVSLLRVRSTDNLRGGDETCKKSLGSRGSRVKDAYPERRVAREDCADDCKVEPPQYLSEKEFFNLSRLICERLGSEEIFETGNETFLNFIDQALLDLKYPEFKS